MFRHKFSQTGLPYLVMAIILIATIIYLERHLSFLSNTIQAISITPNHDDNFEKTDINDGKVASSKLKPQKNSHKQAINGNKLSLKKNNPTSASTKVATAPTNTAFILRFFSAKITKGIITAIAVANTGK